MWPACVRCMHGTSHLIRYPWHSCPTLAGNVIMFYPGFGFVILLLSLHASAEVALQPPLSVTQPAKGVLLVADRSMPDPRFLNAI